MVAVRRNPQWGQVNPLVRTTSAAILEDSRGVASVGHGGSQRFSGCFGGVKIYPGGGGFQNKGRPPGTRGRGQSFLNPNWGFRAGHFIRPPGCGTGGGR